MSPTEVSMVLEQRRPKTVGGMHEDDFYELEQRREQMMAKGMKVI